MRGPRRAAAGAAAFEAAGAGALVATAAGRFAMKKYQRAAG